MSGSRFDRMFRGVLAVAVGVAFAVVIGMLFWVDGPRPADETGPRSAEDVDTAELDRLAEESSKALIVAESRSIDADPGRLHAAMEPIAEAPPGFEPFSRPAREPLPPTGYAFVTRHGVERGPMTAADVDRVPSAPPAWMATGEADLTAQAALAGRDWTFGWVKLAEDADIGELAPVVETSGGEILGQAGDLVRARLPGDTRLQAIMSSSSVAGLGALPAERKVAVGLRERALANVHDEVPVWITLMDGDADRRWRRALKDLGAEVGRFDPAVRAYAAVLRLDALGPVASADYVLSVEPIGRLEPTLEFVTSALGADAMRTRDESTGLFAGVGGASVPVGVMDTGLNYVHPDISSNRRSICGVNVVGHTRNHEQDLWFDENGHGSAVTAVAVGNGSMNANRAGMAPLVQDIRFAKVLAAGFPSASALGWTRALDWFAKPTECGDGVPRKALVINSSVGVHWDIWDGRSYVERKIDASVWAARQLFVAAAGNEAEGGFVSMAGAKNALAVGSTDASGEIADSSSRGPTYDGRLLPNVVAPGVGVATAQGAGGVGYATLSGASLASPAVAGVAALVMDAVPALREEPAALRAHLMASAIKPDTFLADADGFRVHNTDGPGRLQNAYGLGKVSARTAVLSRDAHDGWTGGAAAFDIDAESHAYRDIVVPPGSSRLDLVLTWDEPPTEAIVSPVLHDLDLWVDPHVACGTVGKCGRYTSRSRTDNVEWLILRNPTPGVYRVKTLPNRIYGAAPRAGLAWNVIRGPSTPTLAVEVDAGQIEASPGESFDLAVTVSSDGYVVAGTHLRVDCRAPVDSGICHDLELVDTESSHAPGEDGMPRTFRRIGGTEFPLGEIGPDEQQTVTLRLKRDTAGSFRLHFTASGWNARAGSGSVGVVVGAPNLEPPAPTQPPANDDFEAAIRLDDAEGETTLDLQFATSEAGEPQVRATPISSAFRPRSVWYTWTAQETGLARFTLAQSAPDDYSENVTIGVYQGDAPSALVPVGEPKAGGAATFFAQAGTTYRIRLALADWGLTTGGRHRSTPTLTLSWGPGSRPANDDFALAAPINGESGTVRGNNQAATTEPDELMGFTSAFTPAILGPGKAASVWYAWSAPSTGDWRFWTSRETLVVGAYMGAGVEEARLVSGLPGSEVVFPAQAGQEYRISVAAPHAYLSGGDFALSWGPGARSDPGNDDFASPLPVSGRTQFSLDLDPLTVESAEPLETGARTAWFEWQPPVDGRYTARFEWALRFERTTGEAPFQLSAFEGDALEALRVVGAFDASRALQPVLAFDARADASYRIAVGMPRSAAEAPLGRHSFVLDVGETPPNDDLVNAQALSGIRGSVAGSNKYATVEVGEQTGEFGGRSVWYTYRTEESSWVRFDNPRLAGLRFTVYRRDAQGGLELVTIGQTVVQNTPTSASPAPSHVTFYAREGVEYVLRVSISHRNRDGFGGPFGGDFEITWAPSYPPTRLRYVQAVNDHWGYFALKEGTVDPYDFGTVGDMVSNGAGTEIYVATDRGLMVFERSGETGMLAPLQTLEDHPVRGDHNLYWDSAGSALLVVTCNAWKKFTPVEGGGLEYAGNIAGAPCPGDRLMLHGSFVHNLNKPWLIETYEFDADHMSLTFAEDHLVAGIDRAVMTADGRNLYAVTVDGDTTQLLALQRDAQTGGLSISAIVGEGSASGDGATVPGLDDVVAMAVHGSHLFLSLGADVGGADTAVFDLADRSTPVFLDYLPAFVAFPSSRSNCHFSNAWSHARAMDMFCNHRNQYYVVQLNPDDGLVPSDEGRLQTPTGELDAFGNRLPWIFTVRAVTASPDGRHVYLAGSPFTRIISRGNELHVFERVYGNGDSASAEEESDTD